MKPSKILLYVLIVALIMFAIMFFSGCTNDTTTEIRYSFHGSVKITDHYADGMHYKIFHTDSGGMGVINVTLDSLQIEQSKKNDR